MMEKDRLIINFDPHHLCNYRCPHCFIPDKSKDYYKPFTHYALVDEWIRAIGNIPRNVEFSISGVGEPTYFDPFFDFVRETSRLENVTDIIIYTNMSLPHKISKYLKLNNKVTFVPSFHPQMTSFNQFLRDCQPCLEAGKMGHFHFVYTREFSIEEIENWRKKINNLGYWFRVIPDFRIKDLSVEELRYLKRFRYDQEWPYLLKLNRTKGLICSTGKNYVFMTSDGNIKRCTQTKEFLGNILSSYTLYEHSEACPHNHCGTCIRELTSIHKNPLELRNALEISVRLSHKDLIHDFVETDFKNDLHAFFLALLARTLPRSRYPNRPVIDATSCEGLTCLYATGFKPDVVVGEASSPFDYPAFGFAYESDIQPKKEGFYRYVIMSEINGKTPAYDNLEPMIRLLHEGGQLVYGTSQPLTKLQSFNNIRIKESRSFFLPQPMSRLKMRYSAIESKSEKENYLAQMISEITENQISGIDKNRYTISIAEKI